MPRHLPSSLLSCFLPSAYVVGSDVELSSVHHPCALELHPQAIVVIAAGENDVELDFRATGRVDLRDKRVGVDEIHEVVARNQHVTPGAEVLLNAIGSRELEVELRVG